MAGACAALAGGALVALLGGEGSGAGAEEFGPAEAGPAERVFAVTEAVGEEPRAPAAPPLAAAADRLGPPTALPQEPDSDDLPQQAASPRPGTEAAHYRHFVELAERRDGSLAAAAEQVFGVTGPDNERVALLRALWDSSSADAAAWFGRALTDAETRAASEAPVADFAVRFLSKRAASEPAASTILADFVATAPADCDPARLARAAAALAEGPPVATSDEP